ncbi:MBL fold metallo-hydrolase [Cryptosporangium aurantiacum]|uniref:Glyoxylase, beta-lactamase superfamily II n=1 Tax=Cryptosporangium aurantiacum TaxID=134849 RepID=A0A1M7KG61_9ACTN|nr:MBL fold metallo-hydrolase [Cryptosporangium aurantiacum]SHM63834.1 Glyoxylase, beta-lactamase superfamily II [Cryptosporangium aurantiacum]
MTETTTPAGDAITVTGTAQQLAWRDRILPPVERVRPGLWSVPTAMPHNPLRYVLTYLIETKSGLALVDTGWPSEDAWQGLVDGVRETGHELADIDTVIVTHFHGDHFGLAGRVREVSGARVAMHRLDATVLRSFSSIENFVDTDREWLRRRGVPDEEQPEMLPPVDAEGPLWEQGEVDVLLEDGDRPMGAGTPLRVVWTPGHTPGHICLAHSDHDVLLTGDHVLPRISPNISSSPLGDEDTLGQFLDSLALLGDLDVAEVLPAHEYRFAGLPARVRQLLRHHEQRLDEILARLDAGDGPTTAQVAAQLTWSRPWEQNRGFIRRSAIGETYAHLVHLQRRGLVTPGAGAEDAWRRV